MPCQTIRAQGRIFYSTRIPPCWNFAVGATLILNPDRHYGNFGVLFDTDTLEIKEMAPVYDHNRSLLPELDNGHLADPAWYLHHCKPKPGQDFIRSARGLMTDDIRQSLIQLKDFTFQQHPTIQAEQARLDALSRIMREQIRLILSMPA